MEYYSAMKNNKMPICDNMDGPRDYHTKWSQKEKDKYHIISQIGHKWTYLRNRNSLRHREQTYGCQRGKEGKDKLGAWN